MLYPERVDHETQIGAKEIIFMEISSISKQIDQFYKTLKSDDYLGEILISWRLDIEGIRDKIYKLLDGIEKDKDKQCIK